MQDSSFFPISELSTYHSKWTIRARVTHKGQVRTFTSKDGRSSTVFEIHLLDESSMEIRASLFGATAEKFHHKIESGKCYTLSRGQIRVANKQYNRCPHRYEIVFDRDCAIEEVADIQGIDAMKYSFCDLHALQSKGTPCTVDLIGVIASFKPTYAFTSKEGKELVKRELTIADDTSTSISIAIWGERAKQDEKVFEGHPIVSFKGISIREWNDTKSGSLMESGHMDLLPKGPEADRLRTWWAKNGGSANLTSLSGGGGGGPLGHVTLMDLASKPLPCAIDICGVITSFKPIVSFTSREGRDLTKREITVADHSGGSMAVTLWGDRAKKEDSEFDGKVVCHISGVLVKEWNGGRSGSILETGSLTLNPTTPMADVERTWWSEGGCSQAFTLLSSEGGGGSRAATAVSVSEMRKATDNLGPEAQYLQMVCRLALVLTRKQGESLPLYYMACQEPREGTSLTCNRRVTEDGFCASCNRTTKAAPRLNVRCRFSDYADAVWLGSFNEAAQGVLKMSPEKVKELETGPGGRDGLETIIRNNYFTEPLQVNVRARMGTYNSEMRPDISALDARPINKSVHGKALLKNIYEMLGQAAGQVGGA